MHRGMGPPQLRNVLQTLCMATRSSFDVIEDWVEATLLLPDLRLSQAVSALPSMTDSLKPAPSTLPHEQNVSGDRAEAMVMLPPACA